MNNEAYAMPVLYQYGDQKCWLLNEHDEWFSLANIGSRNQRIMNQLLNAVEALCTTVHFFPFLLRSSYEASSVPAMYCDSSPYYAASEADPYAYTPSPAEQQVVRDMLAFIRERQVVPLQSVATVMRMCTRTLQEIANRYEAEADGPLEYDKDAHIVWSPTCLAATCLGITEHSTSFWDVLNLLQKSIDAYAKDKGIMDCLLE